MNGPRGAAKALLFSIVGGAMTGGALWSVINEVVTIKGQGVLEGHGGPFRSPWVAVATGAVVGAIVYGVRHVLQRRRSEGIAATQGLDYQQDASAFLALHDGLKSMPLFAGLVTAIDLTAGSRRGRGFGAFELTTIAPSDPNSESDPSPRRNSVVVWPHAGLPAFDLLPRGFVLNLVGGFAGVKGLAFDAASSPDPAVADVIRRFERAYLVMVSDPKDTPADEANNEPARVEAVRRLVTVDLMRLLLDAPGWSVESHGGHLGMSRSVGGRLRSRGGPAAERIALIDGSMAIAQALDVAAYSTAPVVPRGAGRNEGVTHARSRRRVVLGVAGAILGFFSGFAVFATVMFNSKPRGADLDWLMPGLLFSMFGGVAMGIALGLGVERRLPDPAPCRSPTIPMGIWIGGMMGMAAGFALGGVVSMGMIFGLESFGFKKSSSLWVPGVFFGSMAVGTSSGLVTGVALADRMARRLGQRKKSDESLA